jgi:DNA-binding transcriptional ArsR family regulator
MFISTETQETAIKARLFRGLSDPSRLGILEVLRKGPQTVSEIVDATGLSQSNTSNHLSCLSDCGLVSRSQRGRNVFYQLSDARVETLLVLAEQLLSDVARGVYECTRYSEREPV